MWEEGCRGCRCRIRMNVRWLLEAGAWRGGGTSRFERLRIRPRGSVSTCRTFDTPEQGVLTATPTLIPKVLTKAYILAALPQSSVLEMAWTPMLTLVKTIPFPTPKTANIPAQIGVFVSWPKRIIRPEPMVVRAHPLQMAQRKWPRELLKMETSTEPGRRRQTTGNMLRPL